MTEAKNPLATALGTYYPKDYVVAAVDDPGQATAALAALEAEGFAASAQICPGEQFLANWKDFSAGRNLLQRAVDLFPAEEQVAVEQYLAEAARGASFVTVHVTGPEDRDRARNVLKAHGGHAMRHYGDYVITDL